MDLHQLKTEGEKAGIFPFYTAKGLKERWKCSKQVVNNRRRDHEDFPKPVEGLIKGGTPIYPLHEVIRYENVRGIKA